MPIVFLKLPDFSDRCELYSIYWTKCVICPLSEITIYYRIEIRVFYSILHGKEQTMLNTIIFTIFGYLLGSLLFARYFSDLFCGRDVTADTPDRNPGAFNAYTYGGFWCGALTLICDLLKGFLPVFLFISFCGKGLGLAFVMAAPVLGHIFPIWHKFNGGKGIAVSFGSLLGLAPDFRPVLILALTYLLFSFVFKVDPHFYRLILTYSIAFLSINLFRPGYAVVLGCAAVFSAVLLKIISVRDTNDKMTIRAAWSGNGDHNK